MKSTFKWGLVAPGKIAHTFAQSLDVIPNGELQAVASRDLGRAQAFADQYHAPLAYDTLEELLKESGVDGVYIASPHRFHFEQAKMCLEAGIPVLCEKPLTVNASEAKELVSLSKEKQVFLMEAVWSRFLPVYDKVFEWLKAGEIGEINTIQSSFGFAIPYDRKGRLYDPELAGGALLDMGIYNLTFSQWIMGERPKSISAVGRIGSTGVDEVTSVQMTYANGVISQFTCTCTTVMENVLIIGGTKGCIKIHPNFWGSDEASLHKEGEIVSAVKPHRRNGFEYEVEEAMACIRKGEIESPGISHQQTIETMELMDEIRAQIGLKYNFE